MQWEDEKREMKNASYSLDVVVIQNIQCYTARRRERETERFKLFPSWNTLVKSRHTGKRLYSRQANRLYKNKKQKVLWVSTEPKVFKTLNPFSLANITGRPEEWSMHLCSTSYFLSATGFCGSSQLIQVAQGIYRL